MDALLRVPQAVPVEQLHLIARSAPNNHVTCYVDRRGQRICRKESFFHRVGRYILIAFMVIAGLMLLCCLLCIFKRRAKKNQKYMNEQHAAYGVASPPQGGIVGKIKGLMGKQQQPPPPQGYNMTQGPGQANGYYGGPAPAPHQPPPAHQV